MRLLFSILGANLTISHLWMLVVLAVEAEAAANRKQNQIRITKFIIVTKIKFVKLIFLQARLKILRFGIDDHTVAMIRPDHLS